MAKKIQDKEANRISARVGRYAKVGTNIGGTALKLASKKAFGAELDQQKNASELTAILGTLKGPLMKVAQLISTIPDAIPTEYADKLATLQSSAPPMGWGFVKRRMNSELGKNWQNKFANFNETPSAAASLGQVHQAQAKSGEILACKLQYPDMESVVEADLKQLSLLFSIHRFMKPVIDTKDIAKEIEDRIREELDYNLEVKHMKLYKQIFDNFQEIRIPTIIGNLSTRRLITMSWLEGVPLLEYKDRSLDERNFIATAMFKAWWYPFSHYGIIHGDPHLGNYTIFETEQSVGGINLFDFGCIRIFPAKFVDGVVNLYNGLRTKNIDQIVAAYEQWGFQSLSKELVEVLNIWAGFIYGPLLEDRVRSLAGGVKATAYGRNEAFRVHQALRELGPVRIPREFVFMDRAAIGLGSVFIHLKAELNFFKLFNEQIENFCEVAVAKKQRKLLKEVGYPNILAKN